MNLRGPEIFILVLLFEIGNLSYKRQVPKGISRGEDELIEEIKKTSVEISDP
jgi:hypothetical protein